VHHANTNNLQQEYWPADDEVTYEKDIVQELQTEIPGEAHIEECRINNNVLPVPIYSLYMQPDR
jgi:hypothetical protein